MATVAISGKTGSVSGATGVSEIREFTATVESAELEAISFSSTGYYDGADGILKCSGSFVAIGAKPVVEEVAALVLKSDSEATAKVTISGKAKITTVEYSVNSTGLVEYSADFVYRGEFTVT